MSNFEEYAQKYPSINMERRNGILKIAFHTNGGPLQWDVPVAGSSHKEFCPAFHDIASDRENKVNNNDWDR